MKSPRFGLQLVQAVFQSIGDDALLDGSLYVVHGRLVFAYMGFACLQGGVSLAVANVRSHDTLCNQASGPRFIHEPRHRFGQRIFHEFLTDRLAVLAGATVVTVLLAMTSVTRCADHSLTAQAAEQLTREPEVLEHVKLLPEGLAPVRGVLRGVEHRLADYLGHTARDYHIAPFVDAEVSLVVQHVLHGVGGHGASVSGLVTGGRQLFGEGVNRCARDVTREHIPDDVGFSLVQHIAARLGVNVIA